MKKIKLTEEQIIFIADMRQKMKEIRCRQVNYCKNNNMTCDQCFIDFLSKNDKIEIIKGGTK